ncbi:MAG TPA: hypothetical protein VNZ49_04480 [Bacteroidia bacterium]|jgi:hypothetical protein|nr:hypothetical protein [Bacteroidia bacterium]
MESEKILNERIMAVTLEIQENYPELTKYIIEMKDSNPDEKDPDVNRRRLKEYYDSLINMVKKYKQHHTLQENENRKK